jgi:hypothetical protein
MKARFTLDVECDDVDAIDNYANTVWFVAPLGMSVTVTTSDPEVAKRAQKLWDEHQEPWT